MSTQLTTEIMTPSSKPDQVNEYIQQRVEQYAGWYDKKCGPLKQRFLYIKAATVIGGAVVPVLINTNLGVIGNIDVGKVLTTTLSLLVLLLVSWDGVFQYGKQWKNYRSTEQFLRHEINYFKHRVSFYAELDDVTAFKIFVQRVEDAIAQENSVTLDTLTRDSNVGGSSKKEG